MKLNWIVPLWKEEPKYQLWWNPVQSQQPVFSNHAPLCSHDHVPAHIKAFGPDLAANEKTSHQGHQKWHKQKCENKVLSTYGKWYKLKHWLCPQSCPTAAASQIPQTLWPMCLVSCPHFSHAFAILTLVSPNDAAWHRRTCSQSKQRFAIRQYCGTLQQ